MNEHRITAKQGVLIAAGDLRDDDFSREDAVAFIGHGEILKGYQVKA
jgi:hypothetical protein